MIKAVLFDLDDTLYPEGDFFRSGFAVVASELETRGAGSAVEISETLAAIHFNEGREEVFQKAARRIPFPDEWISEIVKMFRSHHPQINLYPEVASVLRAIRKKYKLGCVTDGWAEVQRRKISALGLMEYLDALVVADDFGRSFWKPIPFPIHRCCEMLGVPYTDAVFVGDNPDRDIKGAKNAGIRSIRIRRRDSYFFSLDCTLATAPDFEINSLTEIDDILTQLLW